RELETGEHFLGDGRAADQRAALEHEHLTAGAREVRRGDQAVVAAADHDRVVAWGAHARFLSGSKNGSLRTIPSARLRRCSTVTSISIGVSGAKCGARRCASASDFLSSG